MPDDFEIELPAATKAILDLVQVQTGKSFQFIHKPDLQVMATVKIARQNMPAHLIYYRNRSENLGHLVAHECGHIIRTMATPAELRKIPATNEATKQIAYDEVKEELLAMSRNYSLPTDKIMPTFQLWYRGLTTQVTNYPVDFRIEKWLYLSYPELRKEQKITIEAEIKAGVEGLSEACKKITPKKVYNASATMNCAYAGFMQKLLGKKYLVPYKKTRFIELGKQLSKEISGTQDLGYEQDLKIINEWVKIFELDTWFEWRDFEDIPENYF